MNDLRPTQRQRLDRARPLRCSPRKSGEAGFILLLMLALGLGAGALGLLAQDTLEGRWRARTQATNAAALASARAALLGYALSYLERHPGQDYGYLPCPDGGNSGSSSLGACAARDLPASGRLPWRSLALHSPTVGSQHCLWYTVAGSAKHNPKPLFLNWDSPGQFSVRSHRGELIPLPAADQRAVALLIAPGAVRAGQQRNAASPCPGAENASLAWPDFVDSTLTPVADGSWQLTHGLTASPDNNDLLSWLSIDDIFAALRRRRDFADHLNTVIDTAADALASRLSDPDFVTGHSTPTADGALRQGLLPAASVLAIAAEATRAHDNWRDQFRFVLCAHGDTWNDEACIEQRDSAGQLQGWCRAVLLFGGERIRSGPGRQQRLSAAERADPGQYLEGDNASNLIAGIARFSGAARFEVRDPQQPASEDVVRCLP